MGLVLAVVGITAVPVAGGAQEKGAELLVESSRVSPAAETQEMKGGCSAMTACPECKDRAVTVRRSVGKGGRVETATVNRHECPTCNTKSVTTGTGKAASTQVMHVCENTKAAACCAMQQSAARSVLRGNSGLRRRSPLFFLQVRRRTLTARGS